MADTNFGDLDENKYPFAGKVHLYQFLLYFSLDRHLGWRFQAAMPRPEEGPKIPKSGRGSPSSIQGFFAEQQMDGSEQSTL